MIIPNGPSIQVTFTVSREGVTHIDLALGQKQGLSWELEGMDVGHPLAKKIEAWLTSYCQKEQPSVTLPLSLHALPRFTQEVLEHLETIPFGQCITYQGLASLLGNAKAARAVGGACGRNPLPLIIPCHRVLASGNRLGGFSCGLPIKQRLLAFENLLARS